MKFPIYIRNCPPQEAPEEPCNLASEKSFLEGQKKDFAEAIAFIEEQIVNRPSLKDLTPDEILLILKGLHQRAARTLVTHPLANFKYTPGEFLKEEVPKLASDFAERLATLLKEEADPIKIASFIQLEVIGKHFFVNANKRVSRLLADAILIHCKVPPPDMHQKTLKNPFSEYYYALETRDLSKLEAFLRAKIAERQSIEQTASLLTVAAGKGDLDALRVALAKPNVSLTIINQASLAAEGNTALHYAVSKGQMAAARLLIEAGASFKTKNCNGSTPDQVKKKPGVSLTEDKIRELQELEKKCQAEQQHIMEERRRKIVACFPWFATNAAELKEAEATKAKIMQETAQDEARAIATVITALNPNKNDILFAFDKHVDKEREGDSYESVRSRMRDTLQSDDAHLRAMLEGMGAAELANSVLGTPKA